MSKNPISRKKIEVEAPAEEVKSEESVQVVEEPIEIAEEPAQEAEQVVLREITTKLHGDELHITIPDIVDRFHADNLLKKLDEIYLATDPNCSWIIDIHNVQKLPITFIGTLHSYSKKLQASDRACILLTGNLTRFNEKLVKLIEKQFSWIP